MSANPSLEKDGSPGTVPRTADERLRHEEAQRSASTGLATRTRRLPWEKIRVISSGEQGDLREGGAPATAIWRDAIFRRLLVTADLLAATAAFVITIGVLGKDSLGLAAIPAIVSVVLVCKLAGLYDRDEHLIHKTTLDEAPTLFQVAALYTLLVFLAGHWIVEGTFGRKQAIIFGALLFTATLMLRWLSRAIAGLVVPTERCLILGNVEAAGWLTTKLDRSLGTKVMVVGRVPLDSHGGRRDDSDALGDFARLSDLLTEYSIDRALIAPGRGDDEQSLLHAIRVVKRLGVRVSVLPRLLEVVGCAFEFDEVEGATLLGVRRHGLTRSSWIIKRTFDLLMASVAIVVLAPLMAMIAAAIRLDSPGGVFFKQRRMGQNDEIFEIFKFRTMVAGADSQRSALAERNEAGGGLFKIENDPRITRVGGLLRKTSLDELPQLINVIRGDMAMVGPRPLILDEDSLIEGHHRHRLLLPPGVTGLWQTLGSARIPLDEMVKIDYLYGANWSLWLDLKIMLRTVPFMLSRRGL